MDTSHVLQQLAVMSKRNNLAEWEYETLAAAADHIERSLKYADAWVKFVTTASLGSKKAAKAYKEVKTFAAFLARPDLCEEYRKWPMGDD